MWNEGDEMMIYISIGAFFGAMLRYFIDQQIKLHVKSQFPLATLIVNISGAFFIGILFSQQVSDEWMAILAIGFLGSFTTFSTLTMDIVTLYTNKRPYLLLLYLSSTFIGGIFLCYMGYNI